MELNQGRPSEREQVLWYEPLDAQWQRLPTFPRFWRGATRRQLTLALMYFAGTYALGFTCAVGEICFDPVLFSHPFIAVFGLISIMWIGTITSFFIGLSVVWVVEILTPAKVRLAGNDLVLDKPRERLPIAEIREARVVGSPTGPQTFTITTANARRSVGIARGADLGELKRLLGARLVFDDDGRHGDAASIDMGGSSG
ncbi:MAG: hypothetical protein ACYCUV_04555 [Phycisphaerae bacterium]